MAVARVRAPGGPVYVLFDGQSLNNYPAAPYNMPSIVMSGRQIPWANVSVDGTSYLNLLTTITTRALSHIRTPSYDRYVAVLNGGSADVADNVSGLTIYTRAETYADTLRAGGFDDIIACTIPPGDLGGLGILYTTEQNVQRDDANARILADAGNAFDATVDVDVPPIDVPLDATYFDNGVHWLYPGALVAADLVGAALDAILAGASFTGGTETTSDGYKIHTFNTSGTLTMVSPGPVEYLVVAGGGGGGANIGGGGGAGGYQTATGLSVTATQTITVGAGGASATDGNDSSLGSLVVSTKGGKGGTTNAAGSNGGSGGGGGRFGAAGGTGTGGQGSNGGAGSNCSSESCGGGGGASAVGVTAPDTGTCPGGDGGAGSVSSISGSSVTRAGGGGGYSRNGTGPSGAGGAGGGGAGRTAGADGDGTAGTVNTGGGGGGAGTSNGQGGAGGSGVVIVRYPA